MLNDKTQQKKSIEKIDNKYFESTGLTCQACEMSYETKIK